MNKKVSVIMITQNTYTSKVMHLHFIILWDLSFFPNDVNVRK